MEPDPPPKYLSSLQLTCGRALAALDTVYPCFFLFFISDGVLAIVGVRACSLGNCVRWLKTQDSASLFSAEQTLSPKPTCFTQPALLRALR